MAPRQFYLTLPNKKVRYDLQGLKIASKRNKGQWFPLVSVSPPPPLTNANTTKGNKSSTSKTLIIIIVPTVAFVVWAKWKEGTALNIVDPTIRPGSTAETMRWIHIGLLCVQKNVADRPNMASVVLMLNSNSITLPAPSKPAFFKHSSAHLDVPSGGNIEPSERPQGNSIQASANVVSISELYPR
ncbi:hypothetical protein FH972_000290 [Carpinus fangiana]|uniref:S-locus receptor kinase C-terminal domain-containing protein n=1 Tax=Carpinus fangiana TaxID=176857 RepID=A0A5N6Q8P3_9ROSI|nr:hypothetical protein FH972_000290 [Carpinus fangiana]